MGKEELFLRKKKKGIAAGEGHRSTTGGIDQLDKGSGKRKGTIKKGIELLQKPNGGKKKASTEDDRSCWSLVLLWRARLVLLCSTGGGLLRSQCYCTWLSVEVRHLLRFISFFRF